jgi:hypothetical protein
VGLLIQFGIARPRGVVPPPDATDDECYLLERFGRGILGPYHPDEEERIVHYIVPKTEQFEPFSLFEREPVTFLEFADIPKTHKGVIAFADRYGLLSASGLEDVDQWYGSIRAMKKAVSAWEHAKATHDFSKIVQLVDRRAQFSSFDALSEDRGVPVCVNLNQDGSHGPVQLSIRPGTLIDALWVELALAIIGNYNYRACSVCGAYYRIEAGGDRPDKTYCSDKCRMKAYRDRKKADL